MRPRIVCALLLLLFTQAQLHAAGFDKSYKVYVGDLSPADGWLDLYVRGTGPIPIIVDDISVTIPSAVAEFVLRNNGNGTFSLVSPLSNAERSSARTWPLAGLDVAVLDVDFNGADDLLLEDLSDVVLGAFDQTVFASKRRGRKPIQVTAHNAKHQSYHRDLKRWLINPNYFTKVPAKLQSAQPATPVWFAAPGDPTDFAHIYDMIAECKALNSGRSCGYTSIDPTPNSSDPKGCIRSVTLRDPNTGQVIGTDPNANVCQRDLHIYVYIPSSVVLTADTSVHDADAKQTADILHDMRVDCSAVPNPSSQAELEGILAGVYGGNIFSDEGRGPANITNSFPHDPFPGDGAFNANDPTFHHYDVSTELCAVEDTACNTDHLSELLRYYSYPSFQLTPVKTKVDYTEKLWAFITVVPAGPLSYVLPAGQIKQQFVQPPFGVGAVQNVTQSNHLVFPGTITRVIRPVGPWIDVFTHGIGINRAFCTQYHPQLPIQIIIGRSNDMFGAAAFRTLDRQMKKFYRNSSTFLPSGSTTGMSKPQFDALLGPAMDMAQ